MGIIKIFQKIYEHPDKIITNLGRRGLLNWMDDETYIKLLYYLVFRHPLNLREPKTFNEKIQWLKLYDRRPDYTKMVDKYEVKKYIADEIGEEFVIPTIGIWDDFEEIDFNGFPPRFVLKCTHDSGGIVICRDKSRLDIKNTRKKLSRLLKQNFFYYGREYPYKNVKPRIMAEQYMENTRNYELKYSNHDNTENELIDYKLLCFNGKVKVSFTCTEHNFSSGLKVTFYDREWNELPFERHYPKSSIPISKPHNYKKMVELAEHLSDGIPLLRVDFYEIQEKLYIGELTFYPGCGLEEFTPSSIDYEMGNWIEIPPSKT